MGISPSHLRFSVLLAGKPVVMTILGHAEQRGEFAKVVFMQSTTRTPSVCAGPNARAKPFSGCFSSPLEP